MKVTDYLAIYGAGLSTFVLIWNIGWTVRLSRSRLKIEIIPSYGLNQASSLDGFLVSVSNPSAVKVTLFEMTVWYEHKKYSAARHLWNRHVRRKSSPEGWIGGLLKTDLYAVPTTLGPGEAIEFVAPLDAVLVASSGHTTVKFCVRDGLMRRHFTSAIDRPQAFP